MSTLNKAFIKAYQRGGVGGPHIPLPTAPPSAAPSPAPATADEAQVAALASGDALVGTVVAAATAAEPTAPADSNSTASFVAHIEAPPQTSDLAAGDDNSVTTASDLRPAFEVERFDWPATVTSLLERGPEIARLISELLPDGRGTLLVTGCRRGEGRTSVALLLARHLAKRGARVAIVDADFHRPQLAARLGMALEAGWEESLSGGLPPGETAVESLADGLTVLPLRRPVSATTLYDGSARVKTLIEQWQKEFDVVCIDAGPLAESDSALHETWLGETQTTAAVVVRDVRHCRLEQTHAIGRKLVQRGVSRWAIVENFCGDPCTKAIGS
jgi:Mrp family chromosome partitioning ATPase